MAEEDTKEDLPDQLLSLIRKIARDEAYEVLDEHLEDYEHKERKVDVSKIFDI